MINLLNRKKDQQKGRGGGVGVSLNDECRTPLILQTSKEVSLNRTGAELTAMLSGRNSINLKLSISAGIS